MADIEMQALDMQILRMARKQNVEARADMLKRVQDGEIDTVVRKTQEHNAFRLRHPKPEPESDPVPEVIELGASEEVRTETFAEQAVPNQEDADSSYALQTEGMDFSWAPGGRGLTMVERRKERAQKMWEEDRR